MEKILFKLGVKKGEDSCYGFKDQNARDLYYFSLERCFLYLSIGGNFLCRPLSDEPLAGFKTK